MKRLLIWLLLPLWLPILLLMRKYRLGDQTANTRMALLTARQTLAAQQAAIAEHEKRQSHDDVD